MLSFGLMKRLLPTHPNVALRMSMKSNTYGTYVIILKVNPRYAFQDIVKLR